MEMMSRVLILNETVFFLIQVALLNLEKVINPTIHPPAKGKLLDITGSLTLI